VKDTKIHFLSFLTSCHFMPSLAKHSVLGCPCVYLWPDTKNL